VRLSSFAFAIPPWRMNARFLHGGFARIPKPKAKEPIVVAQRRPKIPRDFSRFPPASAARTLPMPEQSGYGSGGQLWWL